MKYFFIEQALNRGGNMDTRNLGGEIICVMLFTFQPSVRGEWSKTLPASLSSLNESLKLLHESLS